MTSILDSSTTYAVRPTHHQFTVNGFRMHFVTAGQGPPLLLLHGWPQSWYEWRTVMGSLSEHFTVVAPDLRGLGDSEKPLTGYDRRTPADDVHSLMAELGHRSYGVIGHDLGAVVARNLAGFYPHEVERLLVVEGPPSLPREGEAIPLEAGLRLNHVFVNAGSPDWLATVASWDVETFLGRFFADLDINYGPNVFNPEDVAEYVRVYSLPGAMRAGFEYYALGLRVDTVDGGNDPISVPVQVWFGDVFLGSIFDPIEMWRPHATDLSGGLIEQCGHFVAEERPATVIDKALAFFPTEKGA